MTEHGHSGGHGSADLYAGRAPLSSGLLNVSPIHDIYWEESGCADGIAALCLHGGPGGGGDSHMRRYFNPDWYRIVLFDQRGCGRSVPHSELRDNTTWDLVADMEALRTHLGIDKWILFGGSWGTTLALAYASKHPRRVAGMILRGVFLLTRDELSWFYQSGANRLFPDAYERFASVIPADERHDMIGAFHKRLTGSDPNERMRAAHAWSLWEMDTVSVLGSRGAELDREDFADAFARIECHYFANSGFLPHDGWLLEQAASFADLPGIIIHGRHDVVTPVSSAWALARKWPGARLHIVPGAGHSGQDPGIVSGLVQATNEFHRRFAAT